MPGITFSTEDFNKLVGQKLDEKKLIEHLDYAKAELDSQLTKEMSVKFNDTNQPYLWSVEGLARHFRATLGKSKGIPKLKLEPSELVVHVDKSVSAVRPYIACFLAKGQPLTEYHINQLIQMQEKLADCYGKKRQKAGAGLFPAAKLAFPIYYKAVDPEAISFVPLGMREKLTLKGILQKHPKGKEYSWILKDAKKYPVVLNGQREALTFPPIINSETTGKLSPGDSELLCEVTGTDLNAVNLVSTIFAYALADRGFKIYPAKVSYGTKQIITPDITPRAFTFKPERIKTLLGIDLSEKETKSLLEKAQYNVVGKGKVEIPPYRKDIMHEVDVIEDIGILHGYTNFEPLPLQEYTPGGILPIQRIVDTHRAFWIGAGHQEVMSAVLSNKELLFHKMNVKDTGTIEIENPMSLTYSCVRTWILPILMEVLSKNKHVDYPQKLFEEGTVTISGKQVQDEEHLAAVSAHSTANFTEMRQTIETVLRNAGLACEIQEFELGCFIEGRSAKVVVDGTTVGFFGEIHPSVLKKFGLLVPVVGCEMNLSAAFSLK